MAAIGRAALGNAATRPDLIAHCQTAGHRLHVMPAGSDVDTRADLVDAYALSRQTSAPPALIYATGLCDPD